MTLSRTLAATLAVALALGTAARAEDEAAVSPEVEAQVRATLEAQGYEVRSVVLEGGHIEVYALKDGAMLEIALDDQLNVIAGPGEGAEGADPAN